MKKKFSKYTSLNNHHGTLFNQMETIQKYEFAKKYIQNKAVLDLGCSTGRGLGLMSECANLVVGLDVNEEAVNIANEQYRGNDKIKLVLGNAEKFSYDIGKFDTILIYQTIYLLNVDEVISNVKKILNKNGYVIVMSINPDRADFSPAKYAVKYHKIDELSELFRKNGFETKIYGSIHDSQINYRGKFHSIIRIIKILASLMSIIPKSYRLKKMLKRVFFGPLKIIPDDARELRNIKYIEPKELTDSSLYKNYISYYLVSKLK